MDDITPPPLTGVLPHPEGEHPVAEEGPYSESRSTIPVLQYYPCRGRAEPIRLCLAAARQEWFEPPVGPLDELKGVQLDGYPFRQLPRFVDGVHAPIDIVQSMAILRYLGRKYGMYGDNEKEAAAVDMVLEGFVDLRAKLWDAWWLNEPAKAQYVHTVLAQEKDLICSHIKGPGMACMERLLSCTYPDSPWAVGSKLSIADLALFDLTDQHLVHWGHLMRVRFPALLAHHALVASDPGIAEYLASSNRHRFVLEAEWRQSMVSEHQEEPQTITPAGALA